MSIETKDREELDVTSHENKKVIEHVQIAMAV